MAYNDLVLILSFDTTSEYGGVAIHRDRDCLAIQAAPVTGSYSIALFEIVDHLLSETRLRLRDIDLFAVANGPGAFTGIRVGLAAALAWGNALGRPVRGVSVLAALVEKGRPTTRRAVPILDARRGEFYAGSFRKIDGVSGSSFDADGENLLLNSVELKKFVAEQSAATGGVTCLVRANDGAAMDTREQLNELPVQWLCVSGELVSAVAWLALEAQASGKPPAASELDPRYIRRTDAEINWRG